MQNKKELLYSIIDRDKNELFGILSDLIKINSENFRSYGNETECPQFIREYFDKLGCKTDIYSPLDIPDFKEHPDYLDGRNLENRLNCTALLKGRNSSRSLMLLGHHDTVEIGDEKKWSVPPLGGVIKDGKIYGRGAGDDKSGIAISMFLMKKLKELGIELDYDLLCTAYCDEEHGGSNGALATCLKYKCDDYINIDGMDGEINDCGAGGGGIEFSVSSKNVENNCANAIEGLNFLVQELESFKKNRVSELEENNAFSGTSVAQNGMRIMYYLVGGNGGTDMGEGRLKITYYTDKKETQINEELLKIKEKVDKKLEELGMKELKIKKTTRFFHYIKRLKENRVVDLMKEQGKENGVDFKVSGLCLSDMPMFSIYGSPRTITIGMARGFDMEGGAHQVNEFVECDKLVQYAKIVAGFLMEY